MSKTRRQSRKMECVTQITLTISARETVGQYKGQVVFLPGKTITCSVSLSVPALISRIIHFIESNSYIKKAQHQQF